MTKDETVTTFDSAARIAIDLDKLEELDRAATPGPWFVVTHPGDAWTVQTRPTGVGRCIAQKYADARQEDAAAVVAMRNAMPALIALARVGQQAAATCQRRASAFQPSGSDQQAGAGMPPLPTASARLYEQNGYRRASVSPGRGKPLFTSNQMHAYAEAYAAAQLDWVREENAKLRAQLAITQINNPTGTLPYEQTTLLHGHG